MINFSVELFTLTFKLGRSNGISALFEGTTISSEIKCVCGMLYSWALSAESCLFATEKIVEKVTWIPKFFPFVDNAFHRFELSIGVECSFWKFAKCDNSYFHVDIKMNYVFPCLWKQIRYYLLNGLVANWKQLGTSSSKPWRF